MMKKPPIIVLFSQDLRLADNPALYAATKTGAPLILLYILDDKTPGQWKIGAAQRWWLHESLNSLQKDLQKYQQTLILRKGPLTKTIQQVIKETKASAVYYNRRYEPWLINFKEIKTKSFNASLLIEPWDICTKNGDPFRVFTPFWKKTLEILEPRKPLPTPQLPPYSYYLSSESLDSWELQPHHPNWAMGIQRNWKPGEKQAHKQLEQFLSNKAPVYHNHRDIPSLKGTSQLSPYLHMGEISPHQIWNKINQKNEGERHFLRELGWREFSYHLLYHFPQIPEKNFNPKFNAFPWKTDTNALKKWQKGLTGYPIVDAGMRELWNTGWMHNRVRMIVASFLTKDLLIHWSEGARWFWDTLVDADLANNSASWQWVAGCGADAAPYFRIFNPTLQGKKFDPDGTYIRKWIPELAHLKKSEVHEPWSFSNHNKNYPYPIIDHSEARKRALNLFEKIKNLP